MTATGVELLSLYPPRFIEHRQAVLDRVEEIRRAHLAANPPAMIEIGCNTGALLVGLATATPSARVLGIDWKPGLVRAASERIARRQIDNAVAVVADARMLIPMAIPVGSLDAVYAFFPDPWWKTRHAARRLFDPVFLRVIARRLRPGGRLYVKSDVFDLLYRLRAMTEASGALRPLPAELWPDERAWGLSTRERKCMSSAIPFGRGYYVRRDDFDATLPEHPESLEQFPVDESIDPVSIIKGPAPLDREAWRRSAARDDAAGDDGFDV